MLHEPVLAEEIVRYLDCGPDKNYIDATLGTGGHSKKMLEATGPGGIVVAFEWDDRAREVAKKRLAPYGGRLRLIEDNYKNIGKALTVADVGLFDGAVFDLGVSSLQFDEGERGFSFSKKAPLDMRMDRSQMLTARAVLQDFSEKSLANLIFELGEEKFAKRIAANIVNKRAVAPIETTTELARIVEGSIPARFRSRKIHPATKTFMALRIFVNGELENLKEGLEKALGVIRKGGRLAVISFHSLEDRIVKRFFKEKARGCVCPPRLAACSCGFKPRLRVLTTKPILAGTEEVSANPRARSAKLRVAEVL